jgi:hypothetical protein
MASSYRYNSSGKKLSKRICKVGGRTCRKASDSEEVKKPATEGAEEAM